jgi:3-oxoacyl-[acyl-carrier protein] reductase
MSLPDLNLTGKVAIVTGSTRGIGWATAELLASAGAAVVLNGRTESTLLNDRLRALPPAHKDHAAMAFDVGDPSAVTAAYRQIAKTYGRLDILVNNAGVLGDALVGMIQTDIVNKTLSTNVNGAIYNLQAASRLMMRQRSGSIINLSSIVGRFGNQGQAVYAASKAALLGLTSSAAKELGPSGIRVNAVAPGLIETDMVRHLPEETYARLSRSIALGRTGTATDVAVVIGFLASDWAAYVSGQVIGVDGCMSL